MNSISLRFATGSPQADTILSGIVGIWESVFPNRIRGYYLSGSYSNGSATSTSDLDVVILFKDRYRDRLESDQAQQLCASCEALTPAISVDLGYVSEESIQQADRVSVALQLKFASQLIYGEDTRDQITAHPDARYVRDAMHLPYYGSKFGRPQVDPLVFPLDYPDPQREFYGYESWGLPARCGAAPAGTKLLVTIVSRIATALIAYRTGQYAGSKRDSATLYQTQVHDEWTELVVHVYAHCKQHWEYRIPTDEQDRQHLRRLCREALAFENAFFSLYRVFLLAELQHEDRDNRARAIERLGQMIYPDQAVIDALRSYDRNDDLWDVAQATAEQIQAMLP